MALTLDIKPGHVPFEVTANLRAGASWELPYGLDLAGLLAAHLRRVEKDTLAREGRSITHPQSDTTEEVVYDLDLPLSRCLTGNDWHWLATCAIPMDAADEQETRMFYRTTDSAWAERAATRPLPYFSPKSGPYRDVMMTSPVTMCPAITWRGIGDIEAIRAALKPLWFIGRRRSTGEGRVTSWHVNEVPTDDPGRFTHTDDHDTILRPCPIECAQALAVDYRTGWYAIRPPSWHPDRLVELAMTAEPDDESWFD